MSGYRGKTLTKVQKTNTKTAKLTKKSEAAKRAKIVKGSQSTKATKVRTSTRFRAPKATGHIKKAPQYPRQSTIKLPKQDKYSVIQCPLTTESAMKKIEEINTLVFLCDTRATKPQIRRAVQELYDVKTLKVNTLIRPDGKKKAFVRLTSDYDALDVANRIGII